MKISVVMVEKNPSPRELVAGKPLKYQKPMADRLKRTKVTGNPVKSISSMMPRTMMLNNPTSIFITGLPHRHESG